MVYLKIDNIDFSNIVSELKVNRTNNYNAQINAAGNTVVDYINSKRKIDVGIIPLDDAEMRKLQNAISKFSVSLSFRNPQTGTLEAANCIIPSNNIEYYTIQDRKIQYKACNLSFIEL